MIHTVCVGGRGDIASSTYFRRAGPGYVVLLSGETRLRMKGESMLDLTLPKDAKIDRRLREDLIIWFASTRPDGRPHNVPVWFEWDGATMLIFVQPGSQKVRNLRHESRVVLALDTKDDGEDVVIVEGVAELLAEPASGLMTPTFGTKYAALWDRIASNPAKMAAEYSQAVRVRPERFLAW